MQIGYPTAWRCPMATRFHFKRRKALARWTALLHRRLPHLSLPEAKGLALWSVGIALGCWLVFTLCSLRKRLQEWYLEAGAKKGHGSGGKGFQRRDFDTPTS